MNKIIVTGFVRCGNRWLARLLIHYADGGGTGAGDFFKRNYWNAKVPVTYFGQLTLIMVTHSQMQSFGEIPSDTYVIHTKRDPRDAFVSWYYLLLEGDLLPAESRPWKGYLPWLVKQLHHPIYRYLEGWLELEQRTPEQILWTSHEYARDHKESELLRLMHGMGIPSDPSRAARAAQALNAEPNRKVYKVPDTGKRGVSSIWKHHFDAQDARLIDDAFGDLIVAWGYKDEDWDSLVKDGKA